MFKLYAGMWFSYTPVLWSKHILCKQAARFGRRYLVGHRFDRLGFCDLY